MTTQSEDRVSRLEGIVEQINLRLGDLSREQQSIREQVDRLNDKIDRLRGEMHRQGLLTIGVLGGLMAILRFVG